MGVTPLVGVWIEIYLANYFKKCMIVTPLVGVWIEIFALVRLISKPNGHAPRGRVD